MYQSARRYLPSQASLQAARQASIEAARRASLQAAGVRQRTVDKGRALLHESQLQLKEIELPKFEPPDTSFYALLGTTFNLLNATTGPGLLALPLAFSRCGWFLGTILLILVFGLNHAALMYLLKSCLTTREHSYIGLCLRHSPELAALVDWASCAFFAGSCVSYLVIIGDTFSGFTALLGEGLWYDGGDFMHYSGWALVGLVTFTLTCLAPLSTLRSMDSLQYTSAVAMLCILYAVAIIVIAPGYTDGFDLTPTATPHVDVADQRVTFQPPNRHSLDAVTSQPPRDQPEEEEVIGAPVPFAFSSQTLLSLPTMAFCFASQSLFPPALETLHQPATYDHMTTVVNVTMCLTLVLHMLVALGGYLRFGAAVSPNVLDCLPQNGLVQAAQLAIVLAFAFTYPMMIFLCRMHLQSTMARAALMRQQTDNQAGGGGEDVGAATSDEHHRLISLLLVGMRPIASSILSIARPFLSAASSSPLPLPAACGLLTSALAALAPLTLPAHRSHLLPFGILLRAPGGTLVLAIVFPNIDAIFGLLGGTTAVVISFVAPALFWERFVGFMYPWRHPRKLFARLLIGFAAIVASLSLPSLLIDLLSDLYATTWWVPVYSGAGFGHWEGGIKALADHDAALARGASGGGAGGMLARAAQQPERMAQAVGAVALSVINSSSPSLLSAIESADSKMRAGAAKTASRTPPPSALHQHPQAHSSAAVNTTSRVAAPRPPKAQRRRRARR